MTRLIAIIATLLYVGMACAQVWIVGEQSGRVFGSTWIHGVAFTANPDLSDVETFDVSWFNGTVCTALSPNHEYAAVEWVYRNGELWWCEDGLCDWIDGGGYVVGIDDLGDMWGSSSAANCYAVLWTDDGLARWEFPAWYRIESRTHDAVTVTHRDTLRTQETIARYDANCDGRVDFFDVDPFVNNLLGWDAQPCNTFWYENADVDAFVQALIGE